MLQKILLDAHAEERERDRQWREGQAELQRAFQEKQIKLAEATMRVKIIVPIIAAVIGGAIGVFGTLLAVLLGRCLATH